MPSSSIGRAWLALAVGVAAISWSAVFVRFTHMPGIASAFYRVFFAALMLWPMLLRDPQKLRRIDGSVLRMAMLGGFFFACDVGLYNTAALHTTAGGVTLLGNNAPIFVGLLSWAITRRPPPMLFWGTLALSTTGVLLIMRADTAHLGIQISADIMAVSTAFCFALYLLVTERLRDRCDSATLLALSSATSAAVLLPVALVTHTSLRIPSPGSWAAVLGLALICQVIGYFSLTYALGHMPATISSVILLGVSPLSAFFAYLTLGEHLTGMQLLGGTLVLLAIWLAGRIRRTS
ncbi:DMT family transporter [Silvibacterium sp.]|uniref:DMT family transporter n=1 Tax=Silvibacterium sp. TaxID=1964179 RepID=UPI0039E54C90